MMTKQPESSVTRIVSSLSRADWRGWIAVAWVFFWGGLYLKTAVAPRVMQAIHAIFP